MNVAVTVTDSCVNGSIDVLCVRFPRTAYYGLCSSATFVCYELAVRWSSN